MDDPGCTSIFPSLLSVGMFVAVCTCECCMLSVCLYMLDCEGTLCMSTDDATSCSLVAFSVAQTFSKCSSREALKLQPRIHALVQRLRGKDDKTD